jgi:hypothetical protein
VGVTVAAPRTGGADVLQTSGIHRDVSSLMRRFQYTGFVPDCISHHWLLPSTSCQSAEVQHLNITVPHMFDSETNRSYLLSWTCILSTLRVICVTIRLSYNRGCTIA